MEPPRQPISTVIITQDQAGPLPACVEACRSFSDEILVVDGGSSDGTVAVAKRLGCRVLENRWPGYAAQRNLGADRAAYDWVFFVDTDEVVDRVLADRLRAFRLRPPTNDAAFAVQRVNQFMGEWLPERPERKVRLYDRRRCRVSDLLVHESVDSGAAPVGRMEGRIWHFNHLDLDDATKRLNLYTDLEARVAAQHRPMRPWLIVLRPCARFVQRFFLQSGFRHGWRGLFWSLHWGYWELLREMKVFEARAGRSAGGGGGDDDDERIGVGSQHER